MSTTRYTDLAFEQDSEGLFDLVIDETTRDLKVSDGLEASILVSLFSDRRAAADEVADPMRRRGWIGNLISEVPGDNHGSGLWLYEQARMTGEVVVGVKAEAVQSLEWMVDERLIDTVDAQVISEPSKRQLTLLMSVTDPQGNESIRAYRLADATRRGIIARL